MNASRSNSAVFNGAAWFARVGGLMVERSRTAAAFAE